MNRLNTQWPFAALCLLIGVLTFTVSYTMLGQGPGGGDEPPGNTGGGDDSPGSPPIPGGGDDAPVGPVGQVNEIDQAIYDDDVDALKSLMEGGANPNQLSTGGLTPLYTVIETHDTTDNTLALLQVLIDHGASVNHLDDAGGTPLSFVAGYGGSESESLAKALVEAGANPHLRPSYQGMPFPTPYEMALEDGNFAAAAGMRTYPGHNEPENLEELKLEGHHALLIEQMVRSTDPNEQRRIAEKVIREAYAGDDISEEEIQDFIKQLLDFESPYAEEPEDQKDCPDCPTP